MSEFERLLSIVHTLRSPGGCPWDQAQTPQSMRPYLVEETYEVVDAIEDGDPALLCKELGDLLFQIVLLSEMADQAGDFDVHAVCGAIADKMIARHPHVFDPDYQARDDDGTIASWEARKAKERAVETSMLDGVPRSMPALIRAHRVGEKVSRVGFDWPDLAGVRAKVDEELLELEQAIESGDRAQIQAEYGDVLLSMANLGRFLEIGPEEALREANDRFEGRFRTVEGLARDSQVDLHALSVEELDALWRRAKALAVTKGQT
jgi:MazG family protein